MVSAASTLTHVQNMLQMEENNILPDIQCVPVRVHLEVYSSNTYAGPLQESISTFDKGNQ